MVGSILLPFRVWPGSCPHHFCSHPIGQSLVLYPNLVHLPISVQERTQEHILIVGGIQGASRDSAVPRASNNWGLFSPLSLKCEGRKQNWEGESQRRGLLWKDVNSGETTQPTWGGADKREPGISNTTNRFLPELLIGQTPPPPPPRMQRAREPGLLFMPFSLPGNRAVWRGITNRCGGAHGRFQQSQVGSQ